MTRKLDWKKNGRDAIKAKVGIAIAEVYRKECDRAHGRTNWYFRIEQGALVGSGPGGHIGRVFDRQLKDGRVVRIRLTGIVRHLSGKPPQWGVEVVP